MTRWSIVADLNRCIGCQTCTAACKHANATAPGVQWRKVLDFEAGEFPDVRRTFVPVGCMQCDEPPCLDVCPSTATRKRDDGIVTIDYDLCIGCAYCAVACPYQARSRVDKPNKAFAKKTMRHEKVREDPRRIGVAQKCTFCIDRIDFGLANNLTPGVDPEATPACVNACITSALTFGDAEDPNSNVSKLLDENSHFKMHEDVGTGPGISYLWDRSAPSGKSMAIAPMVAEPVGMDSISPVLQKNWDWRAAANFVFGGTGTGLFAATAAATLFAPTLWPAGLLALLFVGLGLFCVFLEIGRPFRFINVLFHARKSWMTREAIVAMLFFPAGLAALLMSGPFLWFTAALLGLIFLYCQGQILQAAKGIPAWRQKGIVSLIFSTGLTEGLGLFAAIHTVFAGDAVQSSFIALVLLAFVGLRYFAWRSYRHGLGKDGAPTKTLTVLDNDNLSVTAWSQIATALAIGLSVLFPPLLIIGGLLALVTGWRFKYSLITRAAYNQGYAVTHMPARGAGKSSPGIKPGWTAS